MASHIHGQARPWQCHQPPSLGGPFKEAVIEGGPGVVAAMKAHLSLYIDT